MNGEPTNPGPSSFGEKLVALLVLGWSAGWLVRYRVALPDDTLALAVTAAVGIVGLAVGLGIWRARPNAVRAYAVWAVADVVALVVLEARSGASSGWTAFGGLLAALVLLVFGGVLARARRMRLATA
jgi:hypothetical protein